MSTRKYRIQCTLKLTDPCRCMWRNRFPMRSKFHTTHVSQLFSKPIMIPLIRSTITTNYVIFKSILPPKPNDQFFFSFNVFSLSRRKIHSRPNWKACTIPRQSSRRTSISCGNWKAHTRRNRSAATIPSENQYSHQTPPPLPPREIGWSWGAIRWLRLKANGATHMHRLL